MDHVRDGGNVKTTGGDIRREQNAVGRGLESAEVARGKVQSTLLESDTETESGATDLSRAFSRCRCCMPECSGMTLTFSSASKGCRRRMPSIEARKTIVRAGYRMRKWYR